MCDFPVLLYKLVGLYAAVVSLWEICKYCRQQKAKVESAKLNLIKQELDRLDQMINTDISVIRNKIEDASREFLEAQYVLFIVSNSY